MTTPDPVDAIAAALARLRGRRGARPPWAEGRDRGAGWRPGPFGGHGHGHPFGDRGEHGLYGGGDRGRFGGPARLRLLEALVTASAPLTVGELAERIGVDQPRASRLVAQAVDAGWVRREADPADARRTRIALTEHGDAFARGVWGERRSAVASALAGFTSDERHELARLLGRLADAWPDS